MAEPEGIQLKASKRGLEAAKNGSFTTALRRKQKTLSETDQSSASLEGDPISQADHYNKKLLYRYLDNAIAAWHSKVIFK